MSRLTEDEVSTIKAACWGHEPIKLLNAEIMKLCEEHAAMSKHADVARRALDHTRGLYMGMIEKHAEAIQQCIKRDTRITELEAEIKELRFYKCEDDVPLHIRVETEKMVEDSHAAVINERDSLKEECDKLKEELVYNKKNSDINTDMLKRQREELLAEITPLRKNPVTFIEATGPASIVPDLELKYGDAYMLRINGDLLFMVVKAED